jgi:solute:Na+ symporter, SSS family
MTLTPIDWIIIIAYLVGAMWIGIYFSRRASGSIDDYFLAGRKLPWWLAGTSLVATTFAADTPLVVSGFIRKGGIYENWFWWSAAMGFMLGVVFYARLWRRSAVLTDLEFIELRYSGKPAAVLRLFMGVYMGILANCITMGWVMLAMGKVATAAFGWPETIAVPLGGGEIVLSGRAVLLAILILVALSYTMLSGMWGVVMTDLMQFAIAMLGAIALAWIVMADMGGPAQMVQTIRAAGVEDRVFHFIPDFDFTGTEAARLAAFTFIVYIAIQWWAGTRGANLGNQRLLAAKDETHATYMMIWGSVAHYVIRPWPWIVVGLASLVYFPVAAGEDAELAYPRMMVQFLPQGLRGLMVVAFIAAFMSTMDSHLNWGASYLVNDMYKRFINRNASNRHYVAASRVATLVLICLAAMAAWQMTSIEGAWKYLATLGGGIGLVVLLRWFWWRINAWSEISALATSAVLTNILPFMEPLGVPNNFATHLTIVVASATIVWVIVTLLTAPVDERQLIEFFRRVRPGGCWGPIARRFPDVQQDNVARGWPAWFAGVICIYAGIFGIGYLCLAQYGRGLVALIIAAATGWYLLRSTAGIAKSEQSRMLAEPANSPV